MKVKVIHDGQVYMLQDETGRYWMGPRLLTWEAPREPGADVPCWITTSREGAELQAALLQTDPPRELVFVEALNKAIDWHRLNQNDPQNVGNAVIAALTEVRIAWVKAINEGAVR